MSILQGGKDRIIDCGGKYEVHPLKGAGWAVVNGDTGYVRCSFPIKEEAVKEANRLNKEHGRD